MIRVLLQTAGLALALFHMSSTTAIAETVDPGNIGDVFTIRELPFNSLNGQALDGGTVPLQLEFSDMKHIEFSGENFIVSLLFSVNGTPILPTGRSSGFLSDENGANIFELEHIAHSVAENQFNLLLRALDVQDSLIFHGLHVDIALADSDPSGSLQIEGGTLRLNTSTVNSEFEIDALAMPIPATLPLFLTGLAGIGLLARRRKSPR